MKPIVNPKSKILPSVASILRRMGVNPKSSVFQSSIVNLQYSIIVLTAFFIFFMTLPILSMAGTVELPETGQTTCYDEDGNAIACADTGQDGDAQSGVAWPSPRFTDNGDRTVTDNLTGLVWAQDGNLIVGSNWQEALDYVAGMNAGIGTFGYTDWRLPNVNELESLINAEESITSTWLYGQGFTNVQSNRYWSSTSDANNTNYAWDVNMSYGFVYSVYNKTSSYYVWPVRTGSSGSFDNSDIWKTGQTTCSDEDGNVIDCTGTGQDGDIQAGVAWPDPRFTDNGDSTVTDNLTGLVWAQDTNLPGGGMTWQEALDYVAGMNAGTYENFGYTDWRLPNRKEIFSLIDRSQYSPVLPSGHPFTNVQSDIYWPSTSNANVTGTAWNVYMSFGHVLNGYKTSGNLYVWPVRSGSTSCTYSISPTSDSFDSNSDTGSVSVIATSGCDWTADSNDSWITITSGSSGTGDGTVNYSVSENTDTSSRTGTINIAGESFTVVQATTKASMPTARSSLTSSVVNNKIYVIGGWDGNNDFATVEEYDPSTDTWSTKTSMPTARSALTSSVVNGKIYVIGGSDGDNNASATVEEYDPSTDTWSTKTSMPTARIALTSSVVNGKIYVIGGQGGSTVVEEYDPSIDTWSTKTSMPTARYYLTSSVVDGEIYVIGGFAGFFYLVFQP